MKKTILLLNNKTIMHMFNNGFSVSNFGKEI